MTENKSAMERLRSALDTPGSIDFYSLVTAVLAEHDAAQKVPPSEAAKAWSKRMAEAVSDYAEVKADHWNDSNLASQWHREVQPLLDEAVRLMSSVPTPSVKRLRAGWREDVGVAFFHFYSEMGNTKPNVDRITALLDEAEASAAPEPKDDGKLADLEAECDRLDAIRTRQQVEIDWLRSVVDSLVAGRKP